MIEHADLHAVSKIFGQTTVGFSISFGPSRTSFGGMTPPVVLFSLASSGFFRVSGTTMFFSRAGSGSVLSFFASSSVFVPAGLAISNVLVWYRTFRIFDWNFQKLQQRRLPDVTPSPGRSLLSSTSERGRSHLGCHHPVIQWYCCNMESQESKWKSLPKNMLLPKNTSFCQPSRFPWTPHPLSPSTGKILATLDT